jgi:hypothetical protein
MSLETIVCHDAIIIKRDKHKKKKVYYNNLMGCLLLLDETNLSTAERDHFLFAFHTRYWEHKDKYKCRNPDIFPYKLI